MTLSFDQIYALSQGAVCREAVGGGLCLRRFTLQEQRAYLSRREESYLRSFATAGIRLEFNTDSPFLFLEVQVIPSTSRRRFAHSIYADGRRIGELSGELAESEPARILEGRFPLGPGNKRVTVYFPWSVESRILALELEDGSKAFPVKKSRLLLSYGDSITQGYDAPSPEEAYIVRLADALKANLICKAIGGERFWPELPAMSAVERPDLITAAYGTNDWSLSTREEFLRDSLGFFQNLRKRYPDVPILALAPIWRADIHARERQVGEFESVAARLREIASEIPGMRVIDCCNYVPKTPDSFADRKLHPNGEGFRHYSENLLKTVAQEFESK